MDHGPRAGTWVAFRPNVPRMGRHGTSAAGPSGYVYEARPIRFLGAASTGDGWRVKRYTIAAAGRRVADAAAVAAWRTAEAVLPRPPGVEDRHGVAVLTMHAHGAARLLGSRGLVGLRRLSHAPAISARPRSGPRNSATWRRTGSGRACGNSRCRRTSGGLGCGTCSPGAAVPICRRICATAWTRWSNRGPSPPGSPRSWPARRRRVRPGGSKPRPPRPRNRRPLAPGARNSPP